jgi:hypothetical protein
VQASGCLLIGNLWQSFDNRKSIAVDQGGLAAVLNAMKNHPEDCDVQHFGCAALCGVILDDLEDEDEPIALAKAVVDNKGIETVIEAMSKHRHDSNIQVHGCEFVCVLAGYDDNYRKSIIRASGLVAIGEARRIHSYNVNVVREADKVLKAVIA